MADIVLDTIAKTLNNSAKYKKEIAEIDTKLNNITRAIEQGILYDGLLEKVRTLKEKRLELVKNYENSKQNSSQISKQFVTDKLLYLQNAFKSNNVLEYYKAIRNVIKEIVIHPTGDVFIYIKNVVLNSSEKRIRTADLPGMNRTL